MAEEQSRRPKDSAFQQQRLKAWQPLLTPRYVIGTFFLIGILFVPLGIVVLDASNSVVETSAIAYHHRGLGPGKTIDIEIPEDMNPPIYFYYQLKNFYQNHRRYVKSRSDEQLRGDSVSATEACEPLESSSSNVVDGKALPLYPCGLIANSFFNDDFKASHCRPSDAGGSCTSANTMQLEGRNWSDDDIAWETDKDKFKVKNIDRTQNVTSTYTRFGPPRKPGDDPVLLPLPDEQHFMVWMRTAALPTFKKLNRIIRDVSFKKGDIVTIEIDSKFDVAGFDGEKAVILSTTSWLGGKNDFLGYAYIVVGTLCLLLALGFFIKHRVSPRKLGDMQYFNWPGGAGQPVVVENR